MTEAIALINVWLKFVCYWISCPLIRYLLNILLFLISFDKNNEKRSLLVIENRLIKVGVHPILIVILRGLRKGEKKENYF